VGYLGGQVMGCSSGPGRWFTIAVAVGGLIATLAGVAGLGSAGILAAGKMGPLDNVPRALEGEDSQAIAVQFARWAVKEGGNQARRASVAEPASSLLPLPWADDILLEPGVPSAQRAWSGLDRANAGPARPAFEAIPAEDRLSNSPPANPAQVQVVEYGSASPNLAEAERKPTPPVQPAADTPASDSSPAPIVASEIVVTRSSESCGPQQPAMLRVTDIPRTGKTGRLALRVTILEWDRARAMEFAAESHARAAETSPLATSLLEAASGQTTSLLDSANRADLDRLVAFLTAQKVLSPVLDQLVTAESGRPVTLIARGVVSAQPHGGLAGAGARSAAPGTQDLVVTCLPAVADRERIRLRVVPEIAVAGRSAVAGGATRVGVAGAGVAMVLREGQTLAIAGPAEDAAQPRLPGSLPFLTQVLKGRTPTRGSHDFVVLVTPQLAPPL